MEFRTSLTKRGIRALCLAASLTLAPVSGTGLPFVQTLRAETTYTDKTTVQTVQNALNAAGYNCGTADGIIGSNTKNAIQKYQTAHRLSVTGTINDELLISLGLTSLTDTSGGLITILTGPGGVLTQVIKDSAEEKTVDYAANFDTLYNYIMKKGDPLSDGGRVLSSLSDDHVTYIHAFEDAADLDTPKIALYSAHQQNPGGMAQLLYDFAILLEKGQADARFQASRSLVVTLSSGSYSVDASESGTVTLSQCVRGMYFQPDTYTKTDIDIYGNANVTNDVTAADLDDSIAADYANLLDDVPSILKEAGLTLTLEDLGFTGLGS